MFKIKVLFYLICNCFLSSGLIAQFQLSGIVSNAKREVLSNVTLKIVPLHQNKILAYTFTDANGQFNLKLNKQQLDTVELEISCIGYLTKRIPLKGIQTDKLQIELATNIYKLPEVKVKSNPVIDRKDTLSYTIKPFTQVTDAVIGDVLKRIPGIEVTEAGVIKFQGRPINKYYIEGLNLLDDKYNLANRNIPASSVEKVQILENHQPIKILDSISISNQAAINLILTDQSRGKIIGRLKIGAGITPFLLDQEFIPMKFNKKSQFIAAYKYNNSGINYTDELTLLNSSDIANNISGNTIENFLLSIPRANIPQTNSQRFLFNNSHTLTLNQIYKSKNEISVKTNFDFISDKQNQTSGNSNTFYFLNDTIQFQENQKLHLEKILLRLFLTVEKNTNNSYFTNTTKIQFLNNRNNGEQSSMVNTSQSFHNDHIMFSNSGNFINRRRNTLLIGNYLISYSNMPQSLSILPGIYDSILNSRVAYDELLQKLTLKTFYANSEIGLSRRFKKFTIQNTFSANYIDQFFVSDLLKLSSGKYETIAKNFTNNTAIDQYLITNTLNLSYKIGISKISFTMPVSYIDQRYRYSSKDTSNRNFFLNYNLSVQIPLSSRFSVLMTSSASTFYGSPYFSTNGTILANYRVLQNNAGIFNYNMLASNSLLLNYKDALKIIFGSIGITQEQSKQPLIYNQSFLGNLSIMDGILFNNTGNSLNFGGRISKYFIPLKASVALGLSYKKTENFQMNKDQLSTSNVNILNLNSKISSRLGLLIVDHTIQYQTIFSGINKILSPSFVLNQTLSNSIAFSENNYLKLNIEQSYFKKPGSFERNFFFLDLSLKKRLKNKKVDIEANWINILNINNFETLSFSANNRTQSFYMLRPSQAMIKVAFNF